MYVHACVYIYSHTQMCIYTYTHICVYTKIYIYIFMIFQVTGIKGDRTGLGSWVLFPSAEAGAPVDSPANSWPIEKSFNSLKSQLQNV